MRRSALRLRLVIGTDVQRSERLPNHYRRRKDGAHAPRTNAVESCDDLLLATATGILHIVKRNVQTETVKNRDARVRAMPSAVDLFGAALLARARRDPGSAREQFAFQHADGSVHPHSLRRYFRTPQQLMRIERELIALTRGDVLDVGCATGNYLPLIAARREVTSVTALDKGEDTIRAAKELLSARLSLNSSFSSSTSTVPSSKARALRPVVHRKIATRTITNGRLTRAAPIALHVADIFTCDPVDARGKPLRYDTITLLENNLGMAGSIPRTLILLRKLKSLLAPGGQILMVMRNQEDADYHISVLRPMWRGDIAQPIRWAHYNVDYLAWLCERCGLKLCVERKTGWVSGGYCLVRMTTTSVAPARAIPPASRRTPSTS
jgi:SAM-dependent methyltransferase